MIIHFKASKEPQKPWTMARKPSDSNQIERCRKWSRTRINSSETCHSLRAPKRFKWLVRPSSPRSPKSKRGTLAPRWANSWSNRLTRDHAIFLSTKTNRVRITRGAVWTLNCRGSSCSPPKLSKALIGTQIPKMAMSSHQPIIASSRAVNEIWINNRTGLASRHSVPQCIRTRWRETIHWPMITVARVVTWEICCSSRSHVYQRREWVRSNWVLDQLLVDNVEQFFSQQIINNYSNNWQ